jgi:hypothetical protein
MTYFNVRKLPPVLFALIATATLAFAGPGTVVKVNGNSFTVHWTMDTSGKISAHGMSEGGYRGGSREKTFTVTPSTVYSVNGGKGSFANLQKGVHVKVTAQSGVASRVDILP